VKRVGLVGARGYVGAELVRLLAGHPGLELAFVASRERAGQGVAEFHPEVASTLRYAEPTPEAVVAAGLDAVVLALPNDASAAYVEAIDAAAPDTVIVDLSADHRFDERWYYGLPELNRAQCYRQDGAYCPNPPSRRRIANPGCYATAMQLAIAPVLEHVEAPVTCFGVSGYSGAGTAPSDKNDPDALRDNLIPYALAGHVHEREVSRVLEKAVRFMPHVAPHFRGLTVTASIPLRGVWSHETVRERYRAAYDAEPLVDVVEEAPWVSRIAGRHGAQVGGFAVSEDGRRVVVVAVLDNLLKGAATQAVQNLNLAFGLEELAGIPWRADAAPEAA
jgi:N-acetyl-gamma-glutamyl-phosphate reductase